VVVVVACAVEVDVVEEIQVDIVSPIITIITMMIALFLSFENLILFII